MFPVLDERLMLATDDRQTPYRIILRNLDHQQQFAVFCGYLCPWLPLDASVHYRGEKTVTGDIVDLSRNRHDYPAAGTIDPMGQLAAFGKRCVRGRWEYTLIWKSTALQCP